MNNILLFQGDCLEVLKDIPDNSVDSLVTDPPAGIAFMGKAWDEDKGGRKQWIEWMASVMSECIRVLKPGAHGLVWALPRTSHWTATALEDAGFEIRDVIVHLFGTGFPKSMNISIAIDKQSGAMGHRGKAFVTAGAGERKDIQDTNGWAKDPGHKAITPQAKQWDGWGTALKPASEHWILVRKPCAEDTVAANVLKHGVGGINIDGSRIAGKLDGDPNRFAKTDGDGWVAFNTQPVVRTEGRFPANLVLSHNPDCEDTCTPGCAISMLDEQSGQTKSGNLLPGHKRGDGANVPYGGGGASRFFYCAKASKSEKNEGCENLEKKKKPSLSGSTRPVMERGEADELTKRFAGTFQYNTHPTVKSSKLMSYLINMITPPKGIVLDPFMGSGSTGVSAANLNLDFIGIEKEDEYFKIAEERVNNANRKTDNNQD